MTDQTFQPGSGDPTQTTTSTQGGVFGGFTAEDAAKQAKIPDHSELFSESVPVTEPVVPFAGDFPQFGPSEPTVANIPNPFAEDVAPVEEVPVVEEIPTPDVAPVEEIPVVEEIPTPDVAPVEEVPVVEEIPTPDVAPVEEIPVSDIKSKYNELANNIDYLLNANNGEMPEVVGSNTDSSHVDYRFNKEGNLLDITRIETSKEDPEELNENTISFVYDEVEKEVSVFLDDVLLYEEHDLLEDSKKKMQVMDKLNKFIFLTGEKQKDIEKARKAKEAEETEKRRLQDIFRNF